MPEIPECLNRRYNALDELIEQLSTMTSRQSHEECYEPNTNDPGIKLMCDFWNILKEDPDCNLTQAVKQRMGLNTSSYVFKPQRVSCYMAENCRHNKRNERNANDRRNEVMNRIKHIRCENESKSGAGKTCCSKSPSGNVLPLSKVLCNLNEAASFDKKCNARISDLMETQKVLKEQITQLENREKEGVQLLKQADCMWSCMEESYKKRIAESLERQKELLKELREVEKSNTKWRRNRKELEMQVKQLAKCHQDILDKITQKSNDIKCMDLEIADFKKRIESHKKEAEGSKKALNIKKQQSDKRMANISAELSTLTKKLAEEKQCKCNKEKEGEKYVKEAREDLQKICKVLIQKKLESEDLKAERDAALSEIELIKQTCSQCQDRCKKKQESINDEIKRINEEIKTFKVRCIQCHQCTDTEDARKFCNDCPKCMGERECINADDHCDKDPTMDCVCMSVKHKFLDNVFENMYTVLERQSRTRPGKAVANSIVSCLKNSRNGKLNADTRQILQDFILNTVKRNLNLTIIGGAVKTRCEMDADTYKQLMTCLKQVKAVKPKKADKSTPAKKDSCRRWGGSSECNCPGDAKSCVCSKRAPPPPRDPDPCPPVYEEPKPDPSQIIACPHKESTSCGPDCAKQGTSGVGTDISAWKRDPCSEAACPFSTNMRAAQCVLGPELLNSAVKSYSSPTPYIPEDLQNIMITCKCGKTSNKLCKCRADAKQLKAEVVKNVNNSCSKQPGNVINRRNSMTERKLREEVNMSQKKIAQDQVFNKAEKFIDNRVSKQNRGFVPRKDKIIKIQKHMVARASNTNSKADDITFLTNAPSEILAIELDDETIDMIDKKTIEDPNIIVTLNKTASGHIAVKFNSEEDSKNSYRILVKRNPSGTRLLRMNEDIFNKLQSINDNRREEESNILQNIITDKVDNVKSLHNIGIEKQKIVHNKLLEAHERNSPTINKDIKIKLQEIYSDKRSITVKIEKENSTIVLEEIEAPLRKTLSGNIAVDLCRYQGILSDDIKKLILKERAIFLKRSNSGALILNTTSSVNTTKANIKQSASGAFLIVINESIPQIDGTIAIKTSKEKFYKLKIKSANDEFTEPPAVLKLTPSNNYVVIPDKEYESRYNEVIHHILEDDTEYYTSVTRESDDSIVIDFEDIFEPNAFLVRTKSGCCKIVQALKKHDSVDSTRKKISETVYDLLDKMPKTNKNSKDNIINKPIVTNQPTKSISDSHLYRNSYNADTKGLLAQPHALIKKTYSGKYAVVLDKESKNSFIKNLRSYLENNSYGKVPVRKTEDGDIIIVLNGDLQEKSNYGALKITSSGNIYVTIDEEVVKNLGIVDYNKYGSAMNNNSNSIHLIEKLSNPVNKGVTTTCNAKPETCGCDISKCVCSEIRFDKFDWSIQKSMGKEIDSELYGADWNKMKKISNSSIQICDPKFCMETCNSNARRINNIIRTKVSHIRQSESKSAADKKSHSEQCYYVIEAVYPNRRNWFETVSNKTPMIPKFNDKTTENYETDKENEHEQTKSNISENTSIAPDPKKIDNLDENWDSLSYLPPQLPEFLQGLNYPVVS